MKIRLFILIVFLLSYGTILGHDVVYGPHLMPGDVCHHDHKCGHSGNHDNNDNCSRENSCDHLLCMFDVDLHILAHQVNQVAIPDQYQDFCTEILGEHNFAVIRDLDPPPAGKPILYLSPFTLSCKLRGPPAV